MKNLRKLLSLLCLVTITSALSIQAETCCQKAKKAGKACDHKCCVEAAKNKKSCEKCNPKKEENKQEKK
ncbi:MAG: hypothetical protein AB1813_11325 [Verrucomicrobiota bacterium]|jgi:hypothetical protein